MESIIKKVGRFFQSHKVETDSPIFAKEKSEEFIAKDNIEQITDFYTLAGHTESAAREKQSHIYRNVMILIKKQSQKFMM